MEYRYGDLEIIGISSLCVGVGSLLKVGIPPPIIFIVIGILLIIIGFLIKTS